MLVVVSKSPNNAAHVNASSNASISSRSVLLSKMGMGHHSCLNLLGTHNLLITTFDFVGTVGIDPLEFLN